MLKTGTKVRVPLLKGATGTILKQINDRREEPRFYVQIRRWVYSLPGTWLTPIDTISAPLKNALQVLESTTPKK